MADYKEKTLTLRYRILSAVLFLPILIWWIYWSCDWPFLLLITAILLIGLGEYFSMMNFKGISCNEILGYLSVALFPLLFRSGSLAYPAFLLTLIFMAVLVSQIFKKVDYNSLLQSVSATFLGIVYIGWLPAHLLALKSVPGGNNLVFYVFAVTWIGDSCAYFIGNRWGRHKLVASVSPNKSKEGIIAGMSGSILAAFLFVIIFRVPPNHYLFYSASAIIIGIFAIFGDLSESLLKRSIHIKDASDIIPGHGGILDRFDSIFFAAPVMYYLAISLLL